MESFLILAIGLATAQVVLYRIRIKDLERLFILLIFFYLSIFEVSRFLMMVLEKYHFSFYLFPILACVFFIASKLVPDHFPPVRKSFGGVPDFYFLSAFWAGSLWISVFSGREIILDWVCAVALVMGLMVLFGFRERLRLADTPTPFSGFPIILIAAGIFLMALMPVARAFFSCWRLLFQVF